MADTLGRPDPPVPNRRHGTIQRYTDGCRCDECRAAYSVYNRRLYDARTPATIELHGTVGAYRRGCSCDECRAAAAARHRDQRAGIRRARRPAPADSFKPPEWHDSRLGWLPPAVGVTALDLGRIKRTETYRPGRECEVCARPLSRYNPELVCAVCRRAETDAEIRRALRPTIKRVRRDQDAVNDTQTLEAVMADRYAPVFFLRTEDDRRRYFVVDLVPSAEARTGTVIAEVHGEGHAIAIAAALNRQPPPEPAPVAGVAERAVSPYVAPFLQPPLATVPDADGPDAF